MKRTRNAQYRPEDRRRALSVAELRARLSAPLWQRRLKLARSDTPAPAPEGGGPEVPSLLGSDRSTAGSIGRKQPDQ